MLDKLVVLEPCSLFFSTILSFGKPRPILSNSSMINKGGTLITTSAKLRILSRIEVSILLVLFDKTLGELFEKNCFFTHVLILHQVKVEHSVMELYKGCTRVCLLCVCVCNATIIKCYLHIRIQKEISLKKGQKEIFQRKYFSPISLKLINLYVNTELHLKLHCKFACTKANLTFDTCIDLRLYLSKHV